LTEIKDIVEELRSRNILHIRKGHLSLNPMYKHLLDNSSISIIENWQSNFNSTKEGWWCLLHGVEPSSRPQCPICGGISKFNGKGYNLTCGKCNYNGHHGKKEKSKQTCLEKYGVENPLLSKETREKSKQTCLEKYGTEVANQFITKESKLKYEQQCLEKFGVKNAGQSKEAKDKRKQTMLNKYGVEHNFQLLDGSQHSKEIWNKNYNNIIQKRQQTCLEKYGVKEICKSQYFKDKSKISKRKKSELFEKEHNCVAQCKLIRKYGEGWLHLIKDKEIDVIKDPNRYGNYISNDDIHKIIEYISTPHNSFSISKEEIEIREYVESLVGKENVQSNNRTVISTKENKYELDIYVPRYKLAIEYNGIYWHSIENVDKKYHITKTLLCNNKGIRLIHIFENEWKNYKDKCKSLICSALGIFNKTIYARKCTVKELSPVEYKKFCNENHLQGSINSKYKLGLIYNNEIVQVIGIGKSRFNNKELELHRLCTKKFTNVIGGFQKLLKHSLENINGYDSLISYVDLAKYTGIGYEKCGFNYLETTKPSYFYVDRKLQKHNRIEFQKYKLPKILDIYNEKLTEQENMMNNKYLCIYDCGTKKYKYDIND
jgi:hypothetical protein